MTEDVPQQTILIFGRSGQVSEEIARARDVAGADLTFLGLPDFDLMTQSPGDAIRARRPVAVINAAAYTAVDRAESEPAAASRLNADIVAEMAKASAETGSRFIHISTDYVFDGSKAGAYVETDPTGPVSVYGRSKLAGEEAVREIGGDWVIFRTAWVVSAIGSNFVKTMIRLAAEREEVGVVADQWGRPTHARDIASMCLGAAASSSLQGLYHLCGAGDATWADVAEHVFDRLEQKRRRRPTLRRITTADYPTPAQRPANSRLDTCKLEHASAWTPRPWREAVDLCLAELL